MYIKMTCNNCNNTFSYDFTKNEMAIERCPLCGVEISNSDYGYINGLTESFYSTNSKIKGFEVNSIHNHETIENDKLRFDDHVFSSDMNQILELYKNASGDIQNLLTSLLDKFYLLINQDIRKENIDGLNATYLSLDELFYNKIGYKKNDNIL